MMIHLEPKDLDPHPNFLLYRIGENEVGFQKVSNRDLVVVDLRKIADITINHSERTAFIRVLGHVYFQNGSWGFAPTGAVGRPRSSATVK